MVAAQTPQRPPMRSIHGVSNGGGCGGGNPTFDPGYVIPASFMNSFRVTSVAERLAKLVRSGPRFDHRQFFSLCVTLARGIDYAVANNEIPARAHELPALFRQIYQHKNEMLLQAAIMMVMISVKSACKSGWFLANDVDMLLSRTNELGMSFCNPSDVVTQPDNPPPVVSKILDRFYPWMKMSHIFAYLEVKPGFGAYLLDFHVMKNKATAREKIRLFVAQTDNIDTSSCLISPQRANFLLNGKGIERRINSSMDNGPQFPTNVTTMVKFGTNLLQAVGHFNGNYVIVIAFTSEVSSLGPPNLQHYACSLSSADDLDSEIIEGASRISLNCPISFRRLTTPVKGQLCKHHQCFDYGNYIKINSRRPSWRCPQCNQSVMFTDLRIDQRMVEVLKEVGDSVADVMISADGSWQPIRETDDSLNKQDKTLGNEQDESNQCAPLRFSAYTADVVDLTMEGIYENNVMDICETQDVKPSQDSTHGNAEMEFDITGIQNEDSFWSGVRFSNFSASNEPVAPNTRFNPPVVEPMSDPSSTDNMLTPVLTDAVTPTHNRDLGDVHWTSRPTNSLMRNYSVPDDLLLQRPGSSEYGDLTISGEAGRNTRHITRTPVAIQALPAQPLVPVSHQRARPSLEYPMLSGSEFSGATETQQQQFSRSNFDRNFTSEMLTQPYPRFRPMTQNQGPRPNFPSQPPPVQQIVGLSAPSRVPGVSGSYRNYVRTSPSPALQHSQPSPALQHSQPSPGTRVPQMASPPTMTRAPPHLSHMQNRQGGSHSNVASPPGGQHSRMMSQQPAQGARSLPVVPVELQPRRGSSSLMVDDGHRALIGEQRGGNVEEGNSTFPRVNNSSEVTPEQNWRPAGNSTFPRINNLSEVTTEQNWRPAGRMRGSLSGRAFSDALSQNIILPSQVTSPSAIRDPSVNLFSNPSSSGGPSQRPLSMLPPVNIVSPPSATTGSSRLPLAMPPPVNTVSTTSASGNSSQRPSVMPPPEYTISIPSANSGSSQHHLGMPPVNTVSTASTGGGSSQRLSAMPPPANAVSTPSSDGGSSEHHLAMPPPASTISTPSSSGGSSQHHLVMPPPASTVATPSSNGGSVQHHLAMPPPASTISTPSSNGGPSEHHWEMPPSVSTISTPSDSSGSSQLPLAMPPPVNMISTPSASDGSSHLPLHTLNSSDNHTQTLPDQTVQLDVDELH
ncbi:E4 SUMO-protein ligase PIAL2-like isoform X2 [Papaver somniferum]|uniref:E4 SUMO-protein ligase PIAL2-like isoform X2 n=1 Tax=Papaver somniferum TaxID=3469 RepID=UPI000E704ED6|nr:E4 SUMO-protein ligase PIAL2-like isoform X2 [Papaver somniferum]